MQNEENAISSFCNLHSAFCIFIIVLATALRVPGLFTDFWGDEIWSWHIAGQLHSVFGILFSEPALIDNNHPLNTLWLYLLGQNAPIWAYRLPALAAGVGSVLVAMRIMGRWGRAEAIIAGLLFCLSYPLIFYSSEARGYSLCVLLGLLSFDFLETALSNPSQKSIGREILFGCCSVLGFLAHLTFINVYIAAIAWSLVRVRRLEPTTAKRLLRLARLHAIPVFATLFLFHFFIRNMVYGGAAPTSAAAVLLQTLSLTLGGPSAGPVAHLVAAIAVLLFIAGLWFLARQPASTWLFFAVGVVIAPAMVCVRTLVFSERPEPLMLRYFLVCIALLLLSITPLLASLWRRHPRARLVMYLALAMYLCGNVAHLRNFLAMGRGHYGQAMAFIAQRSAGGPIALASDNLLRTDPLVEFYGPRVAAGRIVTLDGEAEPWLILNRATGDGAAFIHFKRHLYEFMQAYPSIDLSGWTWLVYERQVGPDLPN